MVWNVGKVARMTGLEPATSGVTGRRSNQLSYIRIASQQREEGGIGGCSRPVKQSPKAFGGFFESQWPGIAGGGVPGAGRGPMTLV